MIDLVNKFMYVLRVKVPTWEWQFVLFEVVEEVHEKVFFCFFDVLICDSECWQLFLNQLLLGSFSNAEWFFFYHS